MAEGRAVGENSPKVPAELRFTIPVYLFLPCSSVPYHVTISMLHVSMSILLILLAYEFPTYLLNFDCEWLEHRTQLFIMSIFLAPNIK